MAAAAKEEATGRCRWSSPPRTSPRGRPRGAASLMRPSAQGGGEVGAQRCERGRGLREPDCVDACAGCHRSSWRGVRGSAARLRCGRGHEMASGVIVSTDKSARTAAGDVATDKGQGGRACSPAPTRPRDCRGDHCLRRKVRANGRGGGCLGKAARGEGKRGGRPRGDVSFVYEAARTIVWRTVTDDVTAGKEHGPPLQTQPQDGHCGHRLNEATGGPRGASFLWTRPRKGREARTRRREPQGRL